MIDYKEMFIEEFYSQSDIKTKIQYTNDLKAVKKYEEDYENGEEFFNFSDEQISRMAFSLLKGRPYSSLGHCIGVYERYLDWARKKEFRLSNSNSYKKVLIEIKKTLKREFVSTRSSKFITRDTIYSQIEKLESKRELITYLLLFEGVYGKVGKEFLNLKLENLDIENKKLKIYNKNITIPLTVIEQLHLAYLEEYYVGSYNSHHLYEESDYIFKTRSKREDHIGHRKINTMWNILTKKAKTSLGVGVNAQDLNNAGMCFYLRCIELRNGILTDKDYLQIINRYEGVTPSEYTLWITKNTYEAYKNFYIKNNIIFDIDSEIKNILEEINSSDFTYPRDYKGYDLTEKEVELSKEEKEFIKDTDKFLEKFLDITEKDSVVKIRIGQSLFRKKLMERSCKCEICGFDFKGLLIASHCKPWRHSPDNERLDVNNGLLLCPSHDSLFDKGLISFYNDGSILLSDKMTQEQFNLLNINGNEKLYMNVEQSPFIGWHRKEYFNK